MIPLSLSHGINNLTVKRRKINNIKTRRRAIEIDIENLSDKDRSHTPYFRTQDGNWDEWCKFLDNNFSQFRNIIDDQFNLFVNIITTSASSFFSLIEKSKKKVKDGGVRI